MRSRLLLIDSRQFTHPKPHPHSQPHSSTRPGEALVTAPLFASISCTDKTTRIGLRNCALFLLQVFLHSRTRKRGQFQSALSPIPLFI